MKYNHDFVCTYKMMENVENESDDSDDETDYPSMLYRLQLLQAFNMNKWSDDKINTNITELYDTLKDDETMKKIIGQVDSPLGNDLFTKFVIF